ncbi:MAG: FIST C-terminal domain-containing protein [Pseudomonadota bacterium]
MRVATGLTQGRSADPALAAEAVGAAMELAGLRNPQAVLLYLTSDFAANPHPAIAAAARASGCLQVTGCVAAGVFTEEDWVLDAPAAAAMVLGDGLALHPAPDEDEATLTLAAPNALDLYWLNSGGQRYGGVSGDATGQGPYSVWTGGRLQEAGRCELALRGADLRVGVSLGIRPLSRPAELSQVQGHDVRAVGNDTALGSLVKELPLSMRAVERIPTHLLMAGVTYGAPANAVEEGRFHLLPVVGVDGEAKSVTVAGELPPGVDLFWAMRQPQAAEHDMRAMIRRLGGAGSPPPAFALMFPCLGRGPWFYGGRDRDIEVLTGIYPDLPLLGFYGNGEIAHLDGANRLLQYSVVLGLGYAPQA